MSACVVEGTGSDGAKGLTSAGSCALPKSSGASPAEGGKAGPTGRLALGDGGGKTNAPGSKVGGAPSVDNLPSGGRTTSSVSNAGTTFWGEDSEILGFLLVWPAAMLLVVACVDFEDPPALQGILNFAGDFRGEDDFFVARNTFATGAFARGTSFPFAWC